MIGWRPTQALAALSSQLTELSDAFVAKISTVEGRLSRLETQVHAALSTLPDAPSSRVRTTGPGLVIESERKRESEGEEDHWRSSSTRSEAASRLRLHIESCAWPPKPSVFTRP